MNSENEKTKEFLVKFAEAIDLEDVELTIKTKLDDFEWDSLAAISAIALIDEIFGVVINIDQLSKCLNIEDIINIALEK